MPKYEYFTTTEEVEPQIEFEVEDEPEIESNLSTNAEIKGNGIQVKSASYGSNCGVNGSDQTSNLSAACDNKNSCSYLIDHTRIGDPAGGCKKQYDYTWCCDSKCQNAVEPAEASGKTINLRCDPHSASVKNKMKKIVYKDLYRLRKNKKHVTTTEEVEPEVESEVEPEVESEVEPEVTEEEEYDDFMKNIDNLRKNKTFSLILTIVKLVIWFYAFNVAFYLLPNKHYMFRILFALVVSSSPILFLVLLFIFRKIGIM